MFRMLLGVVILVSVYLLYKFSRILFSRMLFMIKLYKLDRENLKIRRCKIIFARMNSQKPALIIETKNNIYIVKICGFLVKLTEVRFISPEMWETQGAAAIRQNRIFKAKLRSQKNMKYDIEPTSKNINIVYLFVPTAYAYYKKEDGKFMFASYGEKVCGGYIHSSKSFLKLLKKDIAE